MTLFLEQELWARLKQGHSARLVINEMLRDGDLKSYKQGLATLEKWARAGAYEYGTSIDLGWPATNGTTPNRLHNWLNEF